jgi:hypothetical protein
MSDYLIKFIGHINERKRPENFPREIYDLLFVRIDEKVGKDGLVNAVNTESMKYIRLQGMTVRMVDPEQMEDLTKIDTERMYVPMHMITHITAEVSGPIVGNAPIVDSTGLASMPDEKKQVKN